MSKQHPFWPAIALMIVLALGLAACGPASTPEPEPTPTRPMRPTFTPSAVPTDTPVPTNTPVPTDTPVPVPTDTPTPAAPKAVIGGDGQVNVRSGPGTAYPETGQVATGSELELVSKNAAGDWYQICCVNGQPAWIVARLVEVTGDPNLIQVAANIPAPPAPTPVPTRPRSAAANATTRAAGPTDPAPRAHPAPCAAVQFVKHTNEPRSNTNPIVSVFGGLYNKSLDLNAPPIGYQLRVQPPGGEPQTVPFGPTYLRGDPGLGSEFFYNAKIEFPFAEGVYRAFVVDSGGNQVSEVWELAVAGETRTFLPRWKQP